MNASLQKEGPDLFAARFYAILDTGYVAPDRWVPTCRALLDGGADLVQLRAKNEHAPRRQALLEQILPLFENRSTPLIVNDDLELALRYPQVGLHVGQDDVSVERAREQLGHGRLLGLSTHSPSQAKEALERAHLLDYFAVGPVFATPTKPSYEPVGLELVDHVARLRPSLPWFCIGGIKLERLKDVLMSGAARVVVVSEVLEAEDPAAVIRNYLEAIPLPHPGP